MAVWVTVGICVSTNEKRVSWTLLQVRSKRLNSALLVVDSTPVVPWPVQVSFFTVLVVAYRNLSMFKCCLCLCPYSLLPSRKLQIIANPKVNVTQSNWRRYSSWLLPDSTHLV